MTDVKFTEVYKVSRPLAKISKNGQFLAFVISNRCVVRNVKTLEVEHIFVCVDVIETIKWSPDSRYLLCSIFKRNIVQAWSIEEPRWTCKIDEGSFGLIDACWSPDSRHILTTASFHMRITVWSLITKTVSYLKYCKAANPGLSFRQDGRFLALAERRDCRDHISIIVCSTWQLVKHFETDTKDLAGVSWSPDGMVLCVWEALTEDYKVLIYSLDGFCLMTYKSYSWALGIKSVSWSPTGQFLAIGSYDQKVRLLNRITFKAWAEFGFPVKITTDMVVYKERPLLLESSSDSSFESHSKYEIITERPVNVSLKPLDCSKPDRHGVGTIKFSSDCHYLAMINDNMPNAVWIWDMGEFAISTLLLHKQPVKYITWKPNSSQLAICNQTNNLFLWSPTGCLVVQVPGKTDFKLQKMKWHPEGNKLLLISRDTICFGVLMS